MLPRLSSVSSDRSETAVASTTLQVKMAALLVKLAGTQHSNSLSLVFHWPQEAVLVSMAHMAPDTPPFQSTRMEAMGVWGVSVPSQGIRLSHRSLCCDRTDLKTWRLDEGRKSLMSQYSSGCRTGPIT